MNETKWAEIVKAAEQAKILTIEFDTRALGLKDFEGLLLRHPKDGMILFKRAQAFERIKHLEKAIEDYRSASWLFPKIYWKNLATAKALHLDRLVKLDRAMGNDQVSDRRFAHIAESARQAAELINQAPLASLDMARTAVIQTIISLENVLLIEPGRNWERRLDTLGQVLRVPHGVLQATQELLSTRNSAVYRGGRVTEGKAEHCCSILIQFLTICFRSIPQ